MSRRGRRNTFEKYKKFKLSRTDATMDEICRVGDYKLQTHQLFLKEWTSSEDWRTLLLYHEIGSGKTCTSITIAEEFLSKSSAHRVKVILPAELRSNFVQELVGKCTGNKYTSEKDASSYEVISIQMFNNAFDNHPLHRSTKEFIQEFTKNSLIIIDEIQNIISTNLNVNIVREVFDSGGNVPIGTKGNAHSFIIRLLVFYADPTAKFVFLTATPFFDKINEIHQLALLMNDHETKRIDSFFTSKTKKDLKLENFVDLFRDKVSYFPKLSANAYPEVIKKTVQLPMPDIIDVRLQELEDKEESAKNVNEAFYNEQKKASLYFRESKVKETLQDDYLNNRCPKIVACAKSIQLPKHVGKHCVYCSYLYALDMLITMLKRNGWSEYNVKDANQGNDYKRFVYWKGGAEKKDDMFKIPVLNVLNSKENIDGRKIKLILGSPAIKAGVSFKHVQFMHILDRTWNIASIRQIEGRVIRYCSHVDITPEITASMGLKRRVTIVNYVLVRENGEPAIDDKLLEIIENKQELTEKAEKMLQDCAFDKWLFRDLRDDVDPDDRISTEADKKSPVLFENIDIVEKTSRAFLQCGEGGYKTKKKVPCSEGFYDFKAGKVDGPTLCCHPDFDYVLKKREQFAEKLQLAINEGRIKAPTKKTKKNWCTHWNR
jgi:hypothetical protein